MVIQLNTILIFVLLNVFLRDEFDSFIYSIMYAYLPFHSCRILFTVVVVVCIFLTVSRTRRATHLSSICIAELLI